MESRMVAARGWKKSRKERDCFMGMKFQFGKMKTVLKMMVLVVAQQCEWT